LAPLFFAAPFDPFDLVPLPFDVLLFVDFPVLVLLSLSLTLSLTLTLLFVAVFFVLLRDFEREPPAERALAFGPPLGLFFGRRDRRACRSDSMPLSEKF
jgi:hypothetical protein